MSCRRRHAGCLQIVLAIGVLVSAGGRAHADPARARQHFELGRRYFQVDEYRKAIDEFKSAHIEEADPAFLYNIAECHRRLGESKEALVYYKRFLNLTPPGAPTRANAERRIAELQAGSAPATPSPEASAPSSPSSPALAPAPANARVALAPRPSDSAPAIGAGPTPQVAAVDLSRAPADQGDRPLYKSPWLYVVLGAVLVAGAAGVWIATSNRTSIPDTPLGNQGVFR